MNRLLFFNKNRNATNTTHEINSELTFGTPTDMEMKYERTDTTMETIFDVMLAESQLDTEYTRSRQVDSRTIDSMSRRIMRSRRTTKA